MTSPETPPQRLAGLPSVGQRQAFLQQRLKRYAELRNDPTKPAAVSNLSPHLHYGHLSAQRAVLETSRLSGLKLAGLFPSGGADSRGSGAARARGRAAAAPIHRLPQRSAWVFEAAAW